MAALKSTKSKKAPAKSAAKSKTASTTAKQKAPEAKGKTKTAASKAKSKAATPKKPKAVGQAESSILQPLFNLRHQIDDMLNETVGRFPHFQLPKIEWPQFARGEGDTEIAKFDFSENDKAVTVTAELPGMTEDAIKITVEDGVLVIKGEKKSEREEKDENFYLSERRFGSFSRAFRLPDGVREEDIKADFQKGILTVTLPKAAKEKTGPRQVSVKSS
jgi:HSP20 family protein